MEQFFLKLSIMLVPALMAITCHEVSHGFVADKFGDNTARSMGRLTLNPLKHLDIFGTLMVFIVGIGWAKPVPVNFNNLRHPKRDMIWVAAAGPITNFALATFSAMLLRGIAAVGENVAAVPLLQLFIDPIALMLAFSVYINLLLAIQPYSGAAAGWRPRCRRSSPIPAVSRLCPHRAVRHDHHHRPGVFYQHFQLCYFSALERGCPFAGRTAE
jgi:hypothetical protein